VAEVRVAEKTLVVARTIQVVAVAAVLAAVLAVFLVVQVEIRVAL
jgi:hypothetical protein